MKKLFILAICSLAFSSCATLSPNHVAYDEKNHPLTETNVMKNMTYNYDEFKKYAFVSPKERWSTSVRLYQEMSLVPYLAINKKSSKEEIFQRLQISLRNDGWLFMQQAHFMCQGRELKINMPYLKVVREIEYGSKISETYDHLMSHKDFNFLKSCKEGDTYRVYGKNYYRDYKFRPEEITYFKEVDFVTNLAQKEGSRKIASISEGIDGQKK